MSGEAARNEGGSPSKEKVRDCDGIFVVAIYCISRLLN